ncbi:5-methylcytosine restriction system specificity protein McrC [Methylobacterium sp. D54C]
MAVRLPRRWTISEYGPPQPIIGQIASASGIDPARVRGLLADAGERVAGALGFERSPLQVTGGSIRAIDFAGLLTPGGGIEIEVVPKFLDQSGSWREDFFLIAVLATHGHVFDETLRASTARDTDLAALVGRALASLYWRNHRRPIRSYETEATWGVELEGDYDPADLLYPEAEGYAQAVTSLSRRNHHNRTIAAAASVLAPLVQDAEIRANLERVIRHLPRQPPPRRGEHKRLPSRASAWRSTYELAIDVIDGMGGSYSAGSREAPGYVVATWQAWESLLTIAARRAFGSGVVGVQREFELGSSSRPGGHRRQVKVAPDLVIDGTRPFIIDVKYKGQIRLKSSAVASADLYEALAFARATGIRHCILAYPHIQRKDRSPQVGEVRLSETIRVHDVTVAAVEVAVAGIAAPGGLSLFAQGVGTGISQILQAL